MERLQMNLKVTKLFGFGILLWTIPFFSSFVFFTPEGLIKIDQFLFESIMTTFFVAVLMFFLVMYFKGEEHSKKEYVFLALVWLGISVFLDLVILVPFAGMTPQDWLMRIGIRYLIIPIVIIGMGLLIPHHKQEHKH